MPSAPPSTPWRSRRASPALVRERIAGPTPHAEMGAATWAGRPEERDDDEA